METIVFKSNRLRVFTIISLFAIFQISNAIQSRRSDNREPAYLFSKVLEALTDAKNEILLSASRSSSGEGSVQDACTQPLQKPLHLFNDQSLASEINLQCPRSTQLRNCLSKEAVMTSVESFWSQDFRTEVMKLCCVIDFCMRNSKDCTSIFPENMIKLLSSQSSSNFTMVFLNKLLCKDKMAMSEECSKMSIIALNLLSAESQIDGISEVFEICNPNMTSDILRLIQIIAGNLTSLEVRQISSQLNGVGIDTSVTKEKAEKSMPSQMTLALISVSMLIAFSFSLTIWAVYQKLTGRLDPRSHVLYSQIHVHNDDLFQDDDDDYDDQIA